MSLQYDLQYEFPNVWFKQPFIEGETISEYFPDSDSKSRKRKVNSIELKTPFIIETPRQDIHIESICVVKKHGQYGIQLLSESEGDVKMDVTISRDLLKVLEFAMNKFDEVDPNV